MQRAFLHIVLFIFGFFYIETYSTLVFVLPIFCVTFAAAIRNNNKNLDIIDMFWLLSQLSFVIAPMVTLEEAEGSQLFAQGVILPLNFNKSMIYEQSYMVELYFILFVVSVINFVFLPYTYRHRKLKNFDIKLSISSILIIFICAVTLEVFMRGGLVNTLAPRRLKEEATGGLFLIFSRTFTLALSIFLVVKLKSASQGLKRSFGYFVLFSLMLLLYNPLNQARFGLLQAHLPLLLITFPALASFRIFSFLILGGMMIIMPILSETTRNGLSSDFSRISLNPEHFLGYLDQHKVLLHLVEIVHVDGLEHGRSILSVVLFFVPRALWSDKPLVLGLEVGNDLYGKGFVATSNLSGPIIGDFYYDFGIIGVVVGSIVVAYGFRKFIVFGVTLNNLPAHGMLILAALPILFRGTVGAVIPIAFFTLVFFYLILFAQNRIRWKR
jgi:hypothetical protein